MEAICKDLDVAEKISLVEATPKPGKYDLPRELWKNCRHEYDGRWILDMTTNAWEKLPWKKQWKYAIAYQKGYAKSIGKPVEQKISVGKTNFELVFIPPGRFWMGSPKEELERQNNENRHRVIISRAFWMQKTEITQGQWKSVMKNNPSHFKNVGDDAPVENISWEMIKGKNGFLVKLGNNWDLPTEAQWEYACRAGVMTPFNLGKNISPELVNYDGNHPYSDGAKGKYRKKTVKVKSLPNANAWGCYDFHGNVCEWCKDWYAAYLENDIDPEGGAGSKRVFRGGSWFRRARRLRSAYRLRSAPFDSGCNLGARLIFLETI